MSATEVEIRRPALDNGRIAGIAAAAAALFYPFALMGFHASVNKAFVQPYSNSSLWLWLIAAICMSAAFAVPLLALGTAMRLGETGGAPYARRVTLLAVASPAILNLLGGTIGNAVPETWVWVIFWSVLLFAGMARTGDAHPSAPRLQPGAARARQFHTAAVVGVVIGLFVLFHVGNQLTGLSGPVTYDRVMKTGRLIYRSSMVEPILITVVLLQLASGIYPLWRDSTGRQDRFRTLQIASGCYLIFFLLSHLNAVLLFGRRVLHGDTGWVFATGGPDGLLRSDRLIPYYALAVFFALVHLALGARRLMLKRNVNRSWADRLVYGVAMIGSVVAVAAILGMSGLHPIHA